MKFEKIISIKEIEPRESYELEVEDNHNFFANDFLKHNCKLSKYDDKFYVFTNGMFYLKQFWSTSRNNGSSRIWFKPLEILYYIVLIQKGLMMMAL